MLSWDQRLPNCFHPLKVWVNRWWRCLFTTCLRLSWFSIADILNPATSRSNDGCAYKLWVFWMFPDSIKAPTTPNHKPDLPPSPSPSRPFEGWMIWTALEIPLRHLKPFVLIPSGLPRDHSPGIYIRFDRTFYRFGQPVQPDAIPESLLSI